MIFFQFYFIILSTTRLRYGVWWVQMVVLGNTSSFHWQAPLLSLVYHTKCLTLDDLSQECEVHQLCPHPIHQLQLSRSESQLPRTFKFFPRVLLGTRPIRWWDARGSWVVQSVKHLPSAQVMILESWDPAPHQALSSNDPSSVEPLPPLPFRVSKLPRISYSHLWALIMLYSYLCFNTSLCFFG